MRYEIRLIIDYDYAVPSDQGRNMLRLLPSDGPHQRVLSRLLTIEPAPDERKDGVDFFGNATSSVAWHRPIDHARFRLTALAERVDPPEEDLSPPLAELGRAIDAMGLEPLSPQHFRAPSPRIPAVAEIADFARAALPEGASARQAVQAIGEALHDAMSFDTTVTDATTPPDQAFQARRGVCQDFAQIMIAGLRANGIPAGYVSGFLRTIPPPGEARLEGVDAMHAWIAAWCGPEQGWVEYDPTNRQWAGEDYIAVAFGRDYGDVAPVRGAIRSAGGHDSRQSVDVIPQDSPV